ncbi:11495_t:CDS:2 [Funneliformis geosporum]|uniref:11495_t:CDS:1 n=1 Tax=Funneliformis geosporum TaxID=1117311 RepID=A0A9W4SY94_9GLOM|nr:11495_t:CDS:2 [Funneliformis geosporum]
MTDTGASPVKDRHIQNLSSTLAAQLGLPVDLLETTLSSVMEQNNFKISQNKQNQRKDSLSSVIEITHDGATSINVKLPSLYLNPPKVQEENSNSKSIAEAHPKPSDVNTTNSIIETLNWPGYSCPNQQDLYVSSNNKSNVPEYQNRQNGFAPDDHMELKFDQLQDEPHKYFQDVDEPYSAGSQSFTSQEINKHHKAERLIDISPPSSSPNHYVIDDNERKQESNEEFEPPSTSMMGKSWNIESQEELGGWEDMEDMGTSYEPIQSFTEEMNSQDTLEPTSQRESNHSFDDGWNEPNVYEIPKSLNDINTDIQQSCVNNIKTFESKDDELCFTISQTNESENTIGKNPDIIDYHVREFVNSPANIKATPEVATQKVQNTIRNKNSEKSSSEWPSLSESAKKSDSKKNNEVDLGAWGPMSTNFASAWGKPKKWISETETKKPEIPATPVWNPDEINNRNWKPIQDPKPPLFKKRRNTPLKYDFDDNEGWGAPPTKCIPWNDSRQGYCVDLIEEQKETTFWSMQNGNWVNVSEESRITQEKKTVEYTPDGSSRREVRQTRTQTQRIERQGIEGSDGVTRNENLETRRELEEFGLADQDNMIINLTDHSDNENDKASKETDFYQPKSTRTITEVPVYLERLGNPQWKTEKEWRQVKQVEECDDLINLDPPSLSDSKSSENDEEQEHGNVHAKSYGESYNFDNYDSSKRFSSDRLIERNKDIIIEQNHFIKAPKNNSLLINLLESTAGCVDSNSKYPQQFHERDNKTEVARSEIKPSESSQLVRNFETFEDSNEYPVLTCNIKQTDNDNSPFNSRADTLGSFTRPKYRCENLSLINMESETTNLLVSDVNNENYVDTVNGTQAVADSEPNSTKPETNGSEFLIHLTIETQSHGRQILHLRHDDDPTVAAAEFCKKWGMLEYEDALKGFVQKEQKKKIRKQKSKRRR